MNVKRFFSKTMQDALRMVREEFGPDAVILSNNRVEGGVEIVAALDYEEEESAAELPTSQPNKNGSQPSPSQIARMHAERHLKLQREMERAKRKIETARKKRQPESRPASASSVAPEQLAGNSVTRGAEGWDELSDMKAEIQELKGLISAQAEQSRIRPVSASSSLVTQQVDEWLHSLCLDRSIARPLLDSVRSENSFEAARDTIRKQLGHAMSVSHGDLIDQGGAVALVGPTGSGKTMTIGKLAARYVMKYGTEGLALVTTDRYRIAAHEQLKVFGRILNVPVHVVDEENCLDSILDRLTDKKLVLIDTAGLMHSDSCWSEQLQELKLSQHGIRNYLVMSAVGQYQVMSSNYHYYKMVGLAGTIITKVDEAVSLGEAISFMVATRLRAAYFTDGQRVPEDIHLLVPDEFMDRAEALLNSSERWVTIRSADSEQDTTQDDAFFFHSA